MNRPRPAVRGLPWYSTLAPIRSPLEGQGTGHLADARDGAHGEHGVEIQDQTVHRVDHVRVHCDGSADGAVGRVDAE
jgi:hypothetical protein